MPRSALFDQNHLPPGVEPPGKGAPTRLGEYRVVGWIGAGGMGAVYAGITASGQAAAVKVIHSQFAADPEFRARFAREVGLVARVRAACAPAFLGADTAAATPWMATEYVPGPTLRQFVRQNGPLSGGMLTALAAGLAEALTAIHASGVVHRDLKPGNVILSPDGPRVLDFGIARAADGTVLTATGGLHGTPGWVAPEQYEGADATGCSDMFAWGGSVAFAATGRDPFGGGAVDGVIHRSRHDEPDLAGVPEPLLGLVRRSLAKDPQERPRADEALAELTRGWSATRIMPGGHAPEAGQDSQPTEVVPELLAAEWRGVPAPGTRRIRRAGRALLLTVTAAVLVVALIGGLVFFDRTPGSGTPGDGGTAEEDPGPVVGSDPEDGVAVAAEAIELLRAAPDLLYRHDSVGDPERVHPVARVLEYTEEPVPVHRRRTYDPAGVAVQLRYGDGAQEQVHGLIGVGLGVSDTVYYHQEGSDFAVWEPEEELAWGLEQILEPDAQIEYQGRSRVPHPQGFMDGGVSDGVSFEETEGHHYSGTVTDPDLPEGEAGEPVVFDLWIDDRGRPLRFSGSTVLLRDLPESSGIPITTTRDYSYEARDIHVPAESEILPGRPAPGI